MHLDWIASRDGHHDARRRAKLDDRNIIDNKASIEACGR